MSGNQKFPGGMPWTPLDIPAGKTWTYTILPGLVGNYSLPAQVSGNNYGTLVYTVIILALWVLKRSLLGELLSGLEGDLAYGM